MCGILGIISYKNSIDRLRLERALNKMQHRGPDDFGVYTHQNVALAMRRLSIIDTEGGHQPISNEDETIWVVMNGEIYNYIELRTDLQQKGHQFKTHSDTEVLVHLYEEYGVSAVDHLNGMFAFALYDLRKNQVWVVRDRLGIKPLYYCQNKENFLFASDLNSLMTYLGKQPLHLGAFYHYFAFNFFPSEQTPYEGVEKLLPGEWLCIKKNKLERKKYWTLQRAENFRGTREEAVYKVNELLLDSVKLQLRSDVPLAISLSGGLDSSAIVAYAAKTGLKVDAYGVNFIGKESQDTFFARQVAERYGINYQEIDLAADDLFTDHEKFMRYLDEPIADSAIYASYKIAEIVRQNGVKVLLSGAGGDEIFGGYHRHFLAPLNKYKLLYQHFPNFIRGLLGNFIKLFNSHYGFRIQEDRVDYGAGMSGAQLALYQNLFLDKQGFQKLVDSYGISLKDVDKTPYGRMLSDIRLYLVDNVLALFDKSTMAASVEGRVPLLDHRLVAFMFSVPQTMNVGRGMKGLFKEVLTDYLPNDLLNRKKEGFNAPVLQWLNQKQMQKVKEVILSQYSQLFFRFFEQKALEKAFDQLTRYRYGEQSIFHLYFLALWFDQVGSLYSV